MRLRALSVIITARFLHVSDRVTSREPLHQLLSDAAGINPWGYKFNQEKDKVRKGYACLPWNGGAGSAPFTFACWLVGCRCGRCCSSNIRGKEARSYSLNTSARSLPSGKAPAHLSQREESAMASLPFWVIPLRHSSAAPSPKPLTSSSSASMLSTSFLWNVFVDADVEVPCSELAEHGRARNGHQMCGKHKEDPGSRAQPDVSWKAFECPVIKVSLDII